MLAEIKHRKSGLDHCIGHVCPQRDSGVLEYPCPPGLRWVCLAQTQLEWLTPCSRFFFLYAVVRECYGCPPQYWRVYSTLEELARESRLLNRLTGRSHHDAMWSETSCPASALRGCCPPLWLRLTGQIPRAGGPIYRVAGSIPLT